MKEFLYILFCVVILGLGIILLNLKGGDELFLADYPVYVSPGVDFSKMDQINSTYKSSFRSQTATKSLITREANKRPMHGPNSSLLPSQETNSGLTQVATHSGGTYGNGTNSVANNATQGSNSGSNMLSLIRPGNGSSENGNGLTAGGALASGGGAFRSVVPLDPVSDYREGDITHPGGNPGQDDQLVSVPVGDGLLPLFLMGVFYVLFALKKEMFRKENSIFHKKTGY